ncbi:MAG: glycosyltransferase family 4 protein [Thiolinea sp.]
MTHKRHVLVSIEFRFYHHVADNSFWTDSAFPDSFWQRYLVIFQQVGIIARAQPVKTLQPGWKRVDSERVQVHPLPYYVGPLGFVRRLPAILGTLRALIRPDAAYIVRVPSILGSVLIRLLLRQRLAYALEVVGDPEDAFAANVIQHPLRPLFRWLFVREMTWQCARARGVAYVTQTRLQQRYPRPEASFTAAYSSIELPASMLLHQPRQPRQNEPLKLLFIGSLEQLYKGLHIVLQALALCRERGQEFSLDVLGEGRYRPQLQQMAVDLKLDTLVRFHGMVPRETGVIPFLDQADLFIHASLTEGLPRVVIEAMARGLPCVATRVGGIPELMPDQDLTPPNDVQALADRICELARQPEQRAAQSLRNLKKAAEYEESILAGRRQHFYQQVAEYC